MRETLLLLALIATTALRVGTGGLNRRAAIAGGAAVTLLPPPGFASSGSMAGKTVLIVRCPVEPPTLYASSEHSPHAFPQTGANSGLGFATETAEDPLARAMSLAKAIAGKNPHAIRAAKRLSNSLADSSDEALLLARTRSARVWPRVEHGHRLPPRDGVHPRDPC